MLSDFHRDRLLFNGYTRHLSTRFVSVDRDSPMLLPPDLREWVKPDDPVHLVLSLVEALPGCFFQVNERGSGSRQYPPSMMLALPVYCYSKSLFSSRRIEQATYENAPVGFLTGDTHPDHDTIAEFRRNNAQAISRCFVQPLIALHLLALFFASFMFR